MAVVNLRESGDLCDGCVEFERIVTLGDTQGIGFVEHTADVVRDSVGRYWLGQRGLMKVFDASGRFLQHVGRPGQGPLEFIYPRPIQVDAQGNVHVFDRNLRESIIGPDFGLVAEHRLPGSTNRAVALQDGHRYVLNAWIATVDNIGLPLHLSQDGNIIRSFGGPAAGDVTITNDFLATRVLGAYGTTVFSAKWYDYLIEVWGEDGSRQGSLHSPGLNLRIPEPALYSEENPAANRIVGLRADGPYTLQVLLWRVRPDWLTALEETVTPDGGVGLGFRTGKTFGDIYYSSLDVLDLRAGTIVARGTAEGLFVGFVGADVIEQIALRDGTPQVGIWRVTIHERRR